MKRKKKGYLNKNLIKEVINKDLEGFKSVDISIQTGVDRSTICRVLNYYRGRNNKSADSLTDKYKKIIDEIKGVESDDYITTKKVYLFGILIITTTNKNKN